MDPVFAGDLARAHVQQVRREAHEQRLADEHARAANAWRPAQPAASWSAVDDPVAREARHLQLIIMGAGLTGAAPSPGMIFRLLLVLFRASRCLWASWRDGRGPR